MRQITSRGMILALVCGNLGCTVVRDNLGLRAQDDPMKALFNPEDPMETLRKSPDGDARAHAFKKLKEPAENGRADEQDEALQYLTVAATTDPAPWVRLSAIDTLGRFRDPRAVTILAQAFQSAVSVPETQDLSETRMMRAAGGIEKKTERPNLVGPQGFSGEHVAAIRGRAIDAMAKTKRPEAVPFLAAVASGKAKLQNEDIVAATFVRQRAIAALGKIPTQESVKALASVLAEEKGKNLAMTDMAHAGLVDLTGKKLPAEPEKWNEIVQTGFELK